MTRWSVLLFAALIASSLYLVQTAYESRRLFAALDRARDEQAQLDIDFKRLQADSQEQATNLRVEKLARDKLAMRAATPSVTHYVDDVAGRAAAAAAAGPMAPVKPVKPVTPAAAVGPGPAATVVQAATATGAAR